MIAFDLANGPAVGFWPRVVEPLAAGALERSESGPPDRTYRQTVLRFEAKT